MSIGKKKTFIKFIERKFNQREEKLVKYTAHLGEIEYSQNKFTKCQNLIRPKRPNIAVDHLSTLLARYV